MDIGRMLRYNANSTITSENVHARYEKLCMDLGGYMICDGTIVAVIDARGKTIKGVFRRIAGNFIVLSTSCDAPPTYIIRHSYIAHIVILGSCHGSTNGTTADAKVRDTQNTQSDNGIAGGTT